MIKLLLKGVIFIMGVQSLLGNLQREGIITGSIKINYPVLQDKIVSIIKSEEFDNLVDRLNESEASKYLSPQVVHAEGDNNSSCKLNRIRCSTHIVRQGETLSNLAEVYGIPWQVIKKINHIYDEKRLQIGQHIIIPSSIG